MNFDPGDCVPLQRSSKFIICKSQYKMTTCLETVHSESTVSKKMKKLFDSPIGIFCTLPSEPSLLLSYLFSEEQKVQLLEWYRLSDESCDESCDLSKDSLMKCGDTVHFQIHLSFQNYSSSTLLKNSGCGKYGIVYLRIDKLGTAQYEYILIEIPFSKISKLIEQLEYEGVQFFLENLQFI